MEKELFRWCSVSGWEMELDFTMQLPLIAACSFGASVNIYDLIPFESCTTNFAQMQLPI